MKICTGFAWVMLAVKYEYNGSFEIGIYFILFSKTRKQESSENTSTVFSSNTKLSVNWAKVLLGCSTLVNSPPGKITRINISFIVSFLVFVRLLCRLDLQFLRRQAGSFKEVAGANDIIF